MNGSGPHLRTVGRRIAGLLCAAAPLALFLSLNSGAHEVAGQNAGNGGSCCDAYPFLVHANAVAPGPSVVPKQIAWRAANGVSVPMFFEVVYMRDDGGASVRLNCYIDAVGNVNPIGTWPVPDPSCDICNHNNSGYGGAPAPVWNTPLLSLIHNSNARQCQTGPDASSPCFSDVDHTMFICPRLAPTVDSGGINAWRFSSIGFWFEGNSNPIGVDASVDGYLTQTNLPCQGGTDLYDLAFGHTAKQYVNVSAWGEGICQTPLVERCANVMFAPK